MSRTSPALTAVVLALLCIALAACGGGGEEKATQTPTEPAGATSTQAATPARPTPESPGTATATAKVGDKTFTFSEGTCDKGPDDAWLTVSIGAIGSADYFSLLVGNPTQQEGGRSAQGGGVFTDGEISFVAGAQGGTSFAMRSTADDKLTLASDLKSGEFAGTSTSGEPMSGSFTC